MNRQKLFNLMSEHGLSLLEGEMDEIIDAVQEMGFKYTVGDMSRAFETGRNFQLTGENNFTELINDIEREANTIN